MKRRKFIKNLGGGISSSILFPGQLTSRHDRPALSYDYPRPENLDELKNEDGHLAVRIVISGKSSDPEERIKGEIRVNHGKINRIRTYFNLGDNQIDTENGSFNLSSYNGDNHILAIWLEGAPPDTTLSLKLNKTLHRLTLDDLVNEPEKTFDDQAFSTVINFLQYHETGYIGKEKLPFRDAGDRFRFIIMADPQGGDPDDATNDSTTRLKIHNAFVEDSIKRANELSVQPLFTFILGDFTDSRGQESNFRSMMKFYEKLNSPILLSIGNHETDYRSVFEPGYNMDAFNNYFAAQKEINGLEKLVYSFDAGEWHFVAWPDPLRANFWETHPHYFDWLEKDMEANKEKPTIILQHVPVHPIGINPLVSYLNPVHINRLLFDIYSRHGNVRYVFSGHVHIPIISSEKTAITYKGINFINLPATGYRPRAFGEEDLYGGPSQGFCIADLDGKEISLSYKTVTDRIYHYPVKFREYKNAEDPLWFNYKWELPASNALQNGNFNDELNGWHRQYIYTESDNPSNICESRNVPGTPDRALYLYSRKRGYDTPGQDRMPQSINRVTQVLAAPANQDPMVRLRYMIDKEHFHAGSLNGAFLWLEGYEGSHLLLSHVYAIGKALSSITGSYARNGNTIFFDITSLPDAWNEVYIRPENDNKTISLKRINKYALTLGTWTVNDGIGQEIGIYFTGISFNSAASNDGTESCVGNQKIILKNKDDIFDSRIHHIAGEHQFASQESLYPY